jgi:hypothetical protein
MGMPEFCLQLWGMDKNIDGPIMLDVQLVTAKLFPSVARKLLKM